MPFRNCFARVFKAAAIRREAPPFSGVYGLSDSRGWIYVGEGDDIRARLLGHLQETDTLLARRAPTGFSFELSPPAERVARQRQIILEFDPVCNDGSSSMRRAS